MYAIVRAGGRQEKVAVGDLLVIDRLDAGIDVVVDALHDIEDAEAHALLAAAFAGKDRLDQAAQEYRTALRLDSRVFTTFVDVESRAAACGSGAGCLFNLNVDAAWQIEFAANAVFRF